MILNTKEDFIKYIEDRAIDKWPTAPYMLSSIGTELKVAGVEYLPLIKPLKLRQFVLATEFERIKAVAHPHHLAAVALVPKSENFAFPDAEPSTDTEVGGKDERPAAPTRTSAYSPAARLLGILSRLSEDDLGRIEIPVDLLVKLHNLK